jgi:hypothetical protein
MKIYNTLGVFVREEIINDRSATTNRNSLENGIYFYRLINDKGEVTRGKFIVD